MGLIDLLPDSIGREEKERLARKLAESKSTARPIPTKEEIARKKAALRKKHMSFNEWVEEFEGRSKIIRRANGIHRMKVSSPKVKRRVRNRHEVLTIKKMRNLASVNDNKKRELAKSGIIIYDHVFMSHGSGFFGGRKKSLEWNDEITRRGRSGIGKVGRKKKRKKNKKTASEQKQTVAAKNLA
ncbi:hypothetical protein IKF04_03885 [Candidatus Saccharibacteria bacterium]|nr:hypothetical protein [Candidatus Saccharibacteria bacterium]